MNKLRILVTLIAVAIATLTIAAPSDAGTAWKPCRTEASRHCVYDAKHHNGADFGTRSFWVSKSKRVHFISHARAHHLLGYPTAVRPEESAPVVTPAPAPASAPAPPAVTSAPVPPEVIALVADGWGAVGDSITDGVGTSDYHALTPWSSGDPEVTHSSKVWPSLLGVPKIARPGGGLWANLHPALLDTFPADVEWLKSQGVTKVLVLIGTNDLGNSNTAADMVWAYQTLQSIGNEHGVQVHFVTLLNRIERQDMHDKRMAVNDWMRTQPGTVDLDQCPGITLMDGVHPDDNGQALMANCVRASIS